MKNILVTGAAGLIGKNIVKKLALKGHKVKAMDFREKFNRDQKYIKFLKDKNLGFFTELKLNRLSFNDDYSFEGFPVASDTLRNALFNGNKKCRVCA